MNDEIDVLINSITRNVNQLSSLLAKVVALETMVRMERHRIEAQGGCVIPQGYHLEK